MDHAEARELLELAALEPGGLDRLTSGADGDSAALLTHLDTCSECRAELTALRRSVATIRDGVHATPSPGLRARTLEHVARFGRDRSQPTAVPGGTGGWFGARLVPAFATAMAAVAMLVAIVTAGVLSSRLADADAAIAEQRTTIAALGLVTDRSLRLGADPDAMHVRLTAPDGGAQSGSLVFSDASNELLMVANGLSAPPAGREYRCWVEADGERVPIGAMYRAGDLAYWAGDIGDAVGDGESRTFGVSLVASSSDGVDGKVVLVGES